MKKITAVCSILLALIMALSCLALPVSAVGVTIVQKPDQTSFYQGVDWMYDKNGTIMLMNGDLNLAGTILSCNGEQVEYKKGVTGPNMYAKNIEESWKAGKNTIHIFCDSFGSNYAVLDVNLKGSFYMMRAVSKLMLRQKYGRIINMSSVVKPHKNSA